MKIKDKREMLENLKDFLRGQPEDEGLQRVLHDLEDNPEGFLASGMFEIYKEMMEDARRWTK